MTSSDDPKTRDTEEFGDLANLPPLLKLDGDVDSDHDIEPVIVGLAEQLKQWRIEQIYATEADPVVAAAKAEEVINDESYEKELRDGIAKRMASNESDASG